MIIKKISEKQLLKTIGAYCLFFPIITLIFIFIGLIVGKIYTLNLIIKDEKIEVSQIKIIKKNEEINSSILYIKDAIETMNKLDSFKKRRDELEKISINISTNKNQEIINLNREIINLNKILIETSQEMKLIIKNEKIKGLDKLFFVHTYKKDNFQSIEKSIIILSNIFGNFLLVWLLFIIYGKREVN